MRHLGLILAILILAPSVASAGDIPRQLDNQSQLLNDLTNLYNRSELDEGVYVGSEFCLACHPGKATWRNTKHAVVLRRPLRANSLVAGQGVVADADGNGVDDFVQGLDLNKVKSAFDKYKPNAPKLGYANGNYTITIGGLTMRVVATSGGSGPWKQRYLVEVPVASGGRNGVSVDLYVSPVQYNEATAEYVPYVPDAWYRNTQPRFGAGTRASDLTAAEDASYSKNCIGCHATGVRSLSKTTDGEWHFQGYTGILFAIDDPAYFDYDRDGLTDLVNVGCEACHGPGSQHILAGGDPRLIVNPDDLDSAQANEVCGQCHLRGESVPGHKFAWPYDDKDGEMFRPGGKSLTAFFHDASDNWPDDVTSHGNHQQYLDFLESPKPGFAYHPVRCTECHAAHGNTSNEHLVRDVLVEEGLSIPTQIDNDTLCLACHAPHGPFAEITKEMVADYEANRDAIAHVVSAHTNHPYAPERVVGLSRCVTCHMPTVANSAIDLDIHSHTFEAISPEKTLEFQNKGGMPNSCDVSCHSVKVNAFGFGITKDLGVWDDNFARRSAKQLQKYFGPGGLWWDTDED